MSDSIYVLGKTDPIGHLVPSYLFNSKAALDNFIRDDNNSQFLFPRDRPNDLFHKDIWFIGIWNHRILAGLDLNEHSWSRLVSLTYYIQMEKKLNND